MTASRVDLVEPVRSILLTAFRIKDYQLIAPDWLREGSDHWVEIRATMPRGSTVEQVPEMLRSLLVERFGLVRHTETRSRDGYHLIVDRAGLKIREVEPVNELKKEFGPPVTETGRRRLDSLADTPDGLVRTIVIPGGPGVPGVPGGLRTITSRTSYERIAKLGKNGSVIINAARMTMPELVSVLTANLDDVVVDRTGLTGVYEFKIELPPDASLARLANSVGLRMRTDSSGLSTFKAIEQLGLKLERRPVPVEVVVIDEIRRTPTEN
jgi:uncharacterized protein (TIGR03435 family)